MNDAFAAPASASSRADAARILHGRALALSRPPAPVAPEGTLIEILEFRLAQERYGVESRFVKAVTPLVDFTPLPGLPPFWRGIVVFRGRLLPILDFKKFFDLPESGLTDLHNILVIGGDDFEIGLLADLVIGLQNHPRESLQPPFPTHTGIRGEYLLGVLDARLIVLDLARLLADPNIIVDEKYGDGTPSTRGMKT